MKPSRLLLNAALLLAVALGAPALAPAVEADGKLPFPDNYRDWIFLSSGLDMSYSAKPMSMDGMGSMFSNVFVNPEAYHEFQKSGHWPEGTELVMEVRGASEKGSINKHGKFQTENFMGVEVHLKDSHFAGGWAFFGFDGTKPAAAIPATADCYACHRDHTAVDTTFVQFYPTLLPIATRKGTLTPGFHR